MATKISSLNESPSLKSALADIVTDISGLWSPFSGMLSGTATYNTASLVDAAGATTTVSVPGAELGDFVLVSLDVDLAGISVTGYVSAADVVSVRIQNESGGTLDLASATVAVRVLPAASFTSTNGLLSGAAVYDTASLADGAGATTTVPVTGAELGDFALVSLGVDLAGITVTGYVSAANVVSVRIQNESGGTLDLASTTIAIRVLRALWTPPALIVTA